MKRETLISVTDAATLLGYHQSRVRQLLAEGRIKGARKVGSVWVIPHPPTVLPPRDAPRDTPPGFTR